MFNWQVSLWAFGIVGGFILLFIFGIWLCETLERRFRWEREIVLILYLLTVACIAIGFIGP